MSVAFLVPSVSRNGGGIYEAVRRIVAELATLNKPPVRVFGLEDSATSSDLAAWQGALVRAAAVVGPKFFGYAPQLERILSSAHSEMIHQHGLWMYPSVACRRWSKRTHRPYIVSPHGMLDHWALKNSSWKKRLAGLLYEDRNLRGAACIHALCEAEAWSIREYGLTNPICVIPNGIDVPLSADAPVPAWEDAGTRGANVLLYLGRLHPKKNLRNLLQAWSKVQIQSPNARDWTLVIAGWSQNGYRTELENAVRRLNISGTVRFAGPQFGDEKHATLRRADACILPSLSEGLPIAVLEAWAYALPVVMTHECNLPEGFAARAAIPCDPNAESIAEAITNLFCLSVAERQATGQRALHLAKGRFAWPKVAAQMAQVYDWLTGHGPIPACVFQA